MQRTNWRGGERARTPWRRREGTTMDERGTMQIETEGVRRREERRGNEIDEKDGK